MKLYEIKAGNGRVIGYKFDIKEYTWQSGGIDALIAILQELKEKTRADTFQIDTVMGYYESIEAIEIEAMIQKTAVKKVAR